MSWRGDCAASSSSSGSRGAKRPRPDHRWGSASEAPPYRGSLISESRSAVKRVLYNSSDSDSDEDDDDYVHKTRKPSISENPRRKSGDNTNLFADFTSTSTAPSTSVQVDRSKSKNSASSIISNSRYRWTNRSPSRPAIVGQDSRNSRSPSRHFFNPLEQMEVPGPALIPEKSEMEEIDEASGCPLVNDWLVDDMGKSPPRMRRQRDPSVERESRALLGLSANSTAGGGESGRPVRTKLARGKSVTRPGIAGRVDRATTMAGPSSRSSGKGRGVAFSEMDGAKRKGGGSTNYASAVAVIESSDSDTEEEFEAWKRKNSKRITELDSKASGCGEQLSAPHFPRPPSSSSSTFSSTPLRIRVRVENLTYLIPCPSKLEDSNKDTPISWLATQASERYSSQRGKRPVLELTTLDGALLYPADAIGHVLKQDEEVIGVVKTWVCPPLAERYHLACRAAGLGRYMCMYINGVGV